MFGAVEPVEMNFDVAAPIADVRQKVVQSLKTQGGRIMTDDGSRVLARFGSQWKVRLLGTILAGASAMPREVAVAMKENSGKTQVSVAVRDTFGFGTRLGAAGKLKELMHENALAIKNLFPASA